MSSQAFAAQLKLQLIAQFRSKAFKDFAFTTLDSLSEFRSFVMRLRPTVSPVGVETGSAFRQFLQHLQSPSITGLDDVLKELVCFLRACRVCQANVSSCSSHQRGLSFRWHRFASICVWLCRKGQSCQPSSLMRQISCSNGRRLKRTNLVHCCDSLFLSPKKPSLHMSC